MGKKRKAFFKSRKVRLEEILEGGKEVEKWFAGIEHKEDQKRKRWERINESSYNR